MGGCRFRILSTAFLCLAAFLAALPPSPAVASNMGFRLERPLDNVRDSRSLYFVSFPFYRSFPDLSGGPAAPQTPDGIVDSADVLLHWYTNGDGCCPGDACDNGENFPDECAGIITLFTFDPDPASNPDQTFDVQSIRQGIVDEIAMIGDSFSIEDPSDPKSSGEAPRGYMAQVVSGEFPTITMGSHNPEWTEWVLTEHRNSRNLYFFSLPYHTTYTRSSEMLEAMWNDMESTKEVITLFAFDPDPVSNREQDFLFQTIRPDIQGTFALFPDNGLDCGDGFCLKPGNGYMIQVVSGGTDGIVRLPLNHW